MGKNETPRAQRFDEFRNTKRSYYSLSTELLHGFLASARTLLDVASAEGRGKNLENYITQHGPSAIIVAVAALEAFVNNTWKLHFLGSAPQVAAMKAIQDSLLLKLQSIPAIATDSPPLEYPEMELVQLVRNELVHPLWRALPPGQAIPQWAVPLEEKGLLITVGHGPDADYSWDQKLMSYQLARWCANTVVETVKTFRRALCGGETDEDKIAFQASLAMREASNFDRLIT